jgi:hypothetical protein
LLFRMRCGNSISDAYLCTSSRLSSCSLGIVCGWRNVGASTSILYLAHPFSFSSSLSWLASLRIFRNSVRAALPAPGGPVRRATIRASVGGTCPCSVSARAFADRMDSMRLVIALSILGQPQFCFRAAVAVGPDTSGLGDAPRTALTGWIFASVQPKRQKADSTMQVDVRQRPVVLRDCRLASDAPPAKIMEKLATHRGGPLSAHGGGPLSGRSNTASRQQDLWLRIGLRLGSFSDAAFSSSGSSLDKSNASSLIGSQLANQT